MLPEVRLQGVPLCPGVAFGIACFYVQEAPLDEETHRSTPFLEKHRLEECLLWMTRRIESLAVDADIKVGSQGREIFQVYRMLLQDVTLREQLFAAIEGGKTACEAIRSHFETYKAQLQATDFEYLRQRCDDLDEIQHCMLNRLRKRALSLLCKYQTYQEAGCDPRQCKYQHILVAKELTSCMAVEMSSYTAGFLVQRGGRNSHAAILVSAMQLPVVGGIQPATIPLDAKILVNGDSGEVVLNPAPETLARHRESITSGHGSRRMITLSPVAGLKVLANIEKASGAQEALAAKAEGIGMYRTEMEALSKGRLLGELEQEACYREVLTVMAGKPVYIRLLDLGADKTPDWLQMPKESNPTLGCRGARLLLARPELLWDQARALARVSRHRQVGVVYPMIVDLDQFRRLRALFEAAVADLRPLPNLLHGVLFEVPSACLQARQLLAEADFGCIGTNDLIQYLFAADRTNESACDTPPDHPTLWHVIEDLAAAARAVNKPISICGELAGNPAVTRRILKAGIRTVSTRPQRIAAVRRSVLSQVF
jgi:phosphotransferase system enzyme I (PtsI)